MNRPRLVSETEIVYSLTQNPSKTLYGLATKQQDAELQKARLRLSRMAGGFQISTSKYEDKVAICRVG